MRIVYVVGARPNFIKTAPVLAAARRALPGAEHILVHTGQHYDPLMSDIFFDELGVPVPDHLLGVGSGTHAQQTASVMAAIEPVLTPQTDLVLVPGDVNSTLAAALVAAKLGILVGHLESGLRSSDWTMPEEINRVLVDRLSSLLFTHSPEARDNLRAEGVEEGRIHQVGNTMIDSLVAVRPRFEGLRSCTKYGFEVGSYLLVTLHRPALVDGPMLAEVLNELGHIASEMPVLFPVHPRTRARIGADSLPPGLRLIEPVGYLEFLSLQQDACAVLTDSGGIQEETTFLGVPCFTLRDNTERPVTCTEGTNHLLGLNPRSIRQLPALVPAVEDRPTRAIPAGWDGRAAERVVGVMSEVLAGL